MKKMRVYSVVKYIIICFVWIVCIQVTIKKFFNVDTISFNLITPILFLGFFHLIGLISKNDYFKDSHGNMIDEKEIFKLKHLLQPFIFLSLLQLFFSFLPLKVWTNEQILGKVSIENHVSIVTFLIIPLPMLIFIFRSFLKRSVVNERDLIKIKRRDSIRSNDLTELDKKVDLEN